MPVENKTARRPRQNKLPVETFGEVASPEAQPLPYNYAIMTQGPQGIGYRLNLSTTSNQIIYFSRCYNN